MLIVCTINKINCNFCLKKKSRIILETDADTIAGKVATNGVDGSVPFSEQVTCFYFYMLYMIIVFVFVLTDCHFPSATDH